MKSAAFSFGLLASTLAVGCGTDSTNPGIDNPPPADPSTAGVEGAARLGIDVTLADGTRPAAGVFEIATDTHLSSQMIGDVNPGTLATARTYYFQVVDADGRLMSTDALDCRTVSIDGAGHILAFLGHPDVATPTCSHGYAAAASGAMTLALAPFAKTATLADGAALYRVVLAPVDGFHGFTDRALTASFRVTAEGVHGCVDNCEPPAPVCGNGTVEDGESCDDGNTTCGDGCDGHCHAE